MDKEWEKLKDLEFEYNIARATEQDEAIINDAKKRYLAQEHKIKMLTETARDEQKNSGKVNPLASCKFSSEEE